jgi:poly-gamma-glutamate synthesis protein (capsule biosynthesis protein)
MSGEDRALRVFLCGDVMTGRGVDQILPHPDDPVLYEPLVHDAREYVRLAEQASGKITTPVDFKYIWGDALAVFEKSPVDLKIVNLETSITARGAPDPHKSIHYRMNPENIGCLTAAGINCCCLANNHVLDWGTDGLIDTIETLAKAGISHAGAGRNITEATTPAVMNVQGMPRVLDYAVGSTTAGLFKAWQASDREPGVNIISDYSDRTSTRIIDDLRAHSQPQDIVIVSIHWDENWNFGISKSEVAFAHRLIDEGVALIHGHSSHHVKAFEIYRRKLILYGCGDFIDDYEGIGGHERFRDDLRLMYFASLDPESKNVTELRMVPVRPRAMRLVRASRAEAQWLCDALNREGARFGTGAQLNEIAAGDFELMARWRHG